MRLAPLAVVASLLLGVAGGALAEAGSPSFTYPFDSGDVVPTNALIPLAGVNGVPFGLTELRKASPRLVAGSHSVPLKVVDTYDDMEGHSKPFPHDGGGYGENLILLAPRWRLKPNLRYSFVVGKNDKAESYFGVTTGKEPDLTPPRWKRPPFLAPAEVDPHTNTTSIPSQIVTAIDEGTDLPLFVSVDLIPQEPRARSKRMIAALHLSNDNVDASACDEVNVYDHEYGVYAEDTDRDLGRHYLARLTAMDAAGNQRRAPGNGVPIVWNGGLSICNTPSKAGPVYQPPALPSWGGGPQYKSSLDPHFDPSQSSLHTRFEHTLTLPLETNEPVFIELTLQRLVEPRTGYRRIAVLETSGSPKANPESSGPQCTHAAITNLDRKKPMPKENERLSLEVAVIDAAGRRAPQPTPPLIVDQLNPWLSRVWVCLQTPSPSSR